MSIHSDLGKNYESNIFSELCRLMEVRKTRTSVRNPKANGQAEVFNRTLVRMIKAYLKGEQTDWDFNLGCLAAAFRATPQFYRSNTQHDDVGEGNQHTTVPPLPRPRRNGRRRRAGLRRQAATADGYSPRFGPGAYWHLGGKAEAELRREGRAARDTCGHRGVLSPPGEEGGEEP